MIQDPNVWFQVRVFTAARCRLFVLAQFYCPDSAHRQTLTMQLIHFLIRSFDSLQFRLNTLFDICVLEKPGPRRNGNNCL